jgi:hypothetical protein
MASGETELKRGVDISEILFLDGGAQGIPQIYYEPSFLDCQAIPRFKPSTWVFGLTRPA